LSFVLPIWFLVVTDPYKDIRYQELSVYSYSNDYQINVILPEPEKEEIKPVIYAPRIGPFPLYPWEFNSLIFD